MTVVICFAGISVWHFVFRTSLVARANGWKVVNLLEKCMTEGRIPVNREEVSNQTGKIRPKVEGKTRGKNEKEKTNKKWDKEWERARANGEWREHNESCLVRKDEEIIIRSLITLFNLFYHNLHASSTKISTVALRDVKWRCTDAIAIHANGWDSEDRLLLQRNDDALFNQMENTSYLSFITFYDGDYWPTRCRVWPVFDSRLTCALFIRQLTINWKCFFFILGFCSSHLHAII